MKAKRAYRDREAPQVAILDALVDRGDEGMTVLELRASVDADIDMIESALGDLKRDGLIEVSNTGGSTVIKPDERVVPDPDTHESTKSLIDWLRDQFPF